MRNRYFNYFILKSFLVKEKMNLVSYRLPFFNEVAKHSTIETVMYYRLCETFSLRFVILFSIRQNKNCYKKIVIETRYEHVSMISMINKQTIEMMYCCHNN